MNLRFLGTDLNNELTRFKGINFRPPPSHANNTLPTNLSLPGNLEDHMAKRETTESTKIGCPILSDSDEPNKKLKGISMSSEDETQENKSSKRSKNVERRICATGHWRPAEDAKLKELVAQFGPQNWNSVAEHLVGRSGKSCRLRWFNQLDPRIHRRAFTDEEEERLMAAHRLYGNKWAVIARLFPGRTDNAVKNHWHVIMARKTRRQCNSIFKTRSKRMTILASPDDGNIKGKNVIWIKKNVARIESASNDESPSTCTDISLTPSSAKPHSCFPSGALPTVQKTGEREEKEQWSDSKANTTTNHNIISFPFYDFLGVGPF